jgi:hypothetical protein
MLFASGMNLEYWWLALIMLPAIIMGPFVALAIVVRSVTNPLPLPTWMCVAFLIFTGLTIYFMIPLTIDGRVSKFWRAWWWFGLMAVLLLPVAVYFEGRKREWFRRQPAKRKRRVQPTAAMMGTRTRRS